MDLLINGVILYIVLWVCVVWFMRYSGLKLVDWTAQEMSGEGVRPFTTAFLGESINKFQTTAFLGETPSLLHFLGSPINKFQTTVSHKPYNTNP